MQFGTATIGSQGGATSSKDLNISFPTPFSSTPTVVVTPIMDLANFPGATDAFASSVFQVTPTGFTARVYRVDVPGIGWGQNLLLGWVADSD